MRSIYTYLILLTIILNSSHYLFSQPYIPDSSRKGTRKNLPDSDVTWISSEIFENGYFESECKDIRIKNSIFKDGCVIHKTEFFVSENSIYENESYLGGRDTTFIKFQYSKINKLTIAVARAVAFFSENNNIQNSLLFWGNDIYRFKSSFDTINRLIFQQTTFPDIIEFENSIISGEIEFNNCNLPKRVDFLNTKLLGNIRVVSIGPSDKLQIYIHDYLNTANIKIRYTKFDMIFDEQVDYSERMDAIHSVLETQKQIGLPEDVEKAEVELKNLQLSQTWDFGLWFQKFLWNYGYNKSLLIYRLLTAFGFFYLINIFIFNKLAKKVYIIPNISGELTKIQAGTKRKWLSHKYYLMALLYSSIIFFGIKMNVEKFNFKFLFLSFYLFIFYLIGLILLFYTIGIFITKL